MKKITFILLALITGTAFGQTTATASADAIIITALKIQNTADLNFGTIAPLSDGPSTFSVSTTGAVGGTATDMVSTDHTVASFTITGDSAQTFDLQVTPPTTLGDGTNTIGFTMDPSLSNGSNELTGGSVTLNIGGQLSLAQNQAPGSYTGEISVTVFYE